MAGPSQSSGGELPITGHLAELRTRLVITMVAVVAGVIVSFIYRDFIFDILLRPGEHDGQPIQLVYTTLTGAIGPTMKVALLGGAIAALPVVVYQAARFLAPGMTRAERRHFIVMLPGVVLAFAGGLAFAYFILIPPIIDFLLTFGDDVAAPLITLESYINTVLALLFWMGVAFETPFLMYFLARFGIVTPEFYARQRRIWLVIAVILGALITPTFDPVNQLMVAAPFVVLYEVGILFSRLAVRGRRRRAAAAEADG